MYSYDIQVQEETSHKNFPQHINTKATKNSHHDDFSGPFLAQMGHSTVEFVVLVM